MAVEYLPPTPRDYNPPLALIGCGAITKHHLTAYRDAGFRVVALCDLDLKVAEERRSEFFPQAKCYTAYQEVLELSDVEVVDIATHPPNRPPIVEAALRADKHVLSQKPFVLDLDTGEFLVNLAKERKRRLAVNQNGRWAPHFSYAREAVRAGLLGQVMGAHLSVHWDHSWVEGTEFENVDDLILYDYAIHWFDIVCCFFPNQTPTRVYASTCRSPDQKIAPPLLGQALIEFDTAQATLAFDGHTPYGSQDRTFVAGSEGTFSSVGPTNSIQKVTLTVRDKVTQPELEGKWFSDGFQGTMGELLCSIEEDREPSHSAASNLNSLALCFAAVASARHGRPFVPGQVRSLDGIGTM